MTEPTFDYSTERYYARLPEFYRSADVETNWTLKRFMSGLMAVYNQMDAMIDRFKYTTPDSGGEPDDTSDLTDPMTADVGWLRWLAQHTGAIINPALSESDQRLAIQQRLTALNQQPGSKGAIANAARVNLTGTRSVNVYDHSTDVGSPGAGTMWDVLIVTVGSETPGGVDPIEDVIAANAKPAGVKLYHRSFESVWADIEAALTTWDDWEAAGSWREIEETGL